MIYINLFDSTQARSVWGRVEDLVVSKGCERLCFFLDALE